MNYYVIENCMPEKHENFQNKYYNLNDIFKSKNKKICFMRNPIYRLIQHYHTYDLQLYGYKNLIEFKQNNNHLFECYVKNLGNLQSIKLCDVVNNSYFLNNTVNDDIFKNSMNNTNKFDAILFYEDYEKNVSCYKYPDYFLECLNELCFYDILLYNNMCKKYKKYNLIL